MSGSIRPHDAVLALADASRPKLNGLRFGTVMIVVEVRDYNVVNTRVDVNESISPTQLQEIMREAALTA